jgi:hypothetical protein
MEWEEYLEKIETEIDTLPKEQQILLSDIYEWVEENYHITEKQKQLVNKIIGE